MVSAHGSRPVRGDKEHRELVQVHLRPPNWTHPEPHSVPVEQFLAMLRFEQRDKVADIVSEAELPIDLDRSGRDDFF